MDKSKELLSQVTTWMKYAKYLPEKNRRETWQEIVSRNESMHIDNVPAK